ncbi:MAG: hypothetical protein ACPG66_06660 [Flavobacteriales bacterium]
MIPARALGGLLLWTTCAAVCGQDDARQDSWGPQPGNVAWSVQEHLLTWQTPHLDLTLDPWITIRHVVGTASSAAEQELTEPWDNLRGARFEARLDGVWEVSGSLEELQGIPAAWDLLTVADLSALPGWGRAKTTAGGRVDVARARVQTTHSQALGSQDSLSWSVAYAPVSWGDLPSQLTFSGRAASFPHGSVAWKRPNWTWSATAARWTGTERGPDGGSTESLFRQTDAVWSSSTLSFSPHSNLGALAGAARARPWVGELSSDSAFRWQPWASVVTSSKVESADLRVSAEWTTHQGWGLSAEWRPDRELRGALSLTRLPAVAGTVMRNAGTPLSDVLRPAGTDEPLWRIEVQGTRSWNHLEVGGRGLSAGASRAAEAWLGWRIQGTWPLSATLGVEVWRAAAHPYLPFEGARLRVGVTHRLGMTPGSPTFDAP